MVFAVLFPVHVGPTIFLKCQKNELMKRQPLNMINIPARLAPRTIPPLIELVFFLFHLTPLALLGGRLHANSVCAFDSKALRNNWRRVLDEDAVKMLDDYVYLFSLNQPSDTE